jgi:hypothetical protein
VGVSGWIKLSKNKTVISGQCYMPYNLLEKVSTILG